MKLKNVSGAPLDVAPLGRVVDDGEIVDAPEFQPDGVSPLVWPEAHWQPVVDKPAKSVKDGS